MMLLTDEEFPGTTNSHSTYLFCKKISKKNNNIYSSSVDNQVLNSKGELERKEIKRKSQKSLEICLNLEKKPQPTFI